MSVIFGILQKCKDQPPLCNERRWCNQPPRTIAKPAHRRHRDAATAAALGTEQMRISGGDVYPVVLFIRFRSVHKSPLVLPPCHSFAMSGWKDDDERIIWWRMRIFWYFLPFSWFKDEEDESDRLGRYSINAA